MMYTDSKLGQASPPPIGYGEKAIGYCSGCIAVGISAACAYSAYNTEYQLLAYSFSAGSLVSLYGGGKIIQEVWSASHPDTEKT